MCFSPGVVPAVRLDEVHVSVFGQEGHQLVVGPETEEQGLTVDWKTYGETKLEPSFYRTVQKQVLRRRLCK